MKLEAVSILEGYLNDAVNALGGVHAPYNAPIDVRITCAFEFLDAYLASNPEGNGLSPQDFQRLNTIMERRNDSDVGAQIEHLRHDIHQKVLSLVKGSLSS
jgi:hypothetical protein